MEKRSKRKLLLAVMLIMVLALFVPGTGKVADMLGMDISGESDGVYEESEMAEETLGETENESEAAEKEETAESESKDEETAEETAEEADEAGKVDATEPALEAERKEAEPLTESKDAGEVVNNQVSELGELGGDEAILMADKDIANCTVTVQNPKYIGKELSPIVFVRDGSLLLIEGVNYNLDYVKKTHVEKSGSEFVEFELTVTGTGDYQGTQTASWHIEPAKPIVIVRGEKGLVYNGAPQNLISQARASFPTDEEYNQAVLFEQEDGSYSEAIPQGTAPGTYTVNYKVESPAEHPYDFEEVSGSEEVTISSTYVVTQGDGGTHSKGSLESLLFKTNGRFLDFTGVKVDGQEVNSLEYNAVGLEDETTIRLKSTYLNTLAVGTHTIEFLYGDKCSCSASFKITKEKTSALSSSGSGSSGGGVGTGDNTNLIVWIIVFVLAGGIGTAIAIKKK